MPMLLFWWALHLNLPARKILQICPVILSALSGAKWLINWFFLPGKPELYAKYIREADRKGVSPGSENLKNLFNECGPCLILMDELVAYAKKIFGV